MRQKWEELTTHKSEIYKFTGTCMHLSSQQYTCTYFYNSRNKPFRSAVSRCSSIRQCVGYQVVCLGVLDYLEWTQSRVDLLWYSSTGIWYSIEHECTWHVSVFEWHAFSIFIDTWNSQTMANCCTILPDNFSMVFLPKSFQASQASNFLADTLFWPK